jgi:hypothetical protein
MALTAAATGAQTATINTEHTLSTQTGIGIYVLHVDTNNLIAGDTVTLQIYSKRSTGDTSRRAATYTYTGVQTEPGKYTDAFPIDAEITATLKQTAGTGRVFNWKLLRA